TALYAERHFLKTEAVHSHSLGDIAKYSIGEEIGLFRAKNNRVENKSFKDKRYYRQDHHGKRGADKMPAQLFQMVQKGHFFFWSRLLFWFHYIIPSLVRLWMCTTPEYFPLSSARIWVMP